MDKTSPSDSDAIQRLILSSVGEGIYATDTNLKVTMWNKGAEHLSGFSEKDVLGKKCMDFVRHMDLSGNILCNTTECLIKAAIESNCNISIKQITIQSSTGKRVPVSTSSAPLINDKGNTDGGVLVFRDTSTEIEQKGLREGLSRMLVHDLRSHLNVISAVLEALKLRSIKEGSSKDSRYLALAYESSLDMDKMIVNILELSKLADGSPLDSKPFSIDKVLNEISIKTKLRASVKGLKFNTDLHAPLPELTGDSYHISRVVDNLIDNAMKFTPSGGEISLSAELKNSTVIISVSDTGPGIPEALRERVFDRYWQGGKFNERLGKGFGLGLALCKMVLEAHSGTITVESNQAQGCRFVCTLPYTHPQAT